MEMISKSSLRDRASEYSLSDSDDVCEWKYDKHFEFAKSECGSIDTHRIEFKKLKYCPYCGKDIKAVK